MGTRGKVNAAHGALTFPSLPPPGAIGEVPQASACSSSVKFDSWEQ